ncbi:MAG TPA: TQO small subunit DoxD [Candidatus Paceibacterota bacterium]|nr:TQO small subunit DoxD [Candidatus Paceibacterota bacterium]
MNDYTIKQSAFAHFFTSNPLSAPLWMIVRIYLGWQWLSAGWEKVLNPAWFGSTAGASLYGFVQGAMSKTGGAHPDVSLWYATFLQQAILPHLVFWSNAIAVGELLVGLGLIVGLFTAAAAFFGFFMNLNYLFAGTVSINPVLLLLALGIMLAHRVAGQWGLDRFVTPLCKKLCYSRKKGATA